MRTSEQTADLFAAIGAMQADLPGLTKDKTATVPMKSGGKYTYRYVGLDTIIEHIGPHLAKHDLAVVQEATSDDGRVGITTRITHSTGQWLECGPLFLPAGGDAQSYGSAVTYGRRYTLSAALGIAADEDDDGAKAKDKPKAETKAEPGSGGRKATQPQIKKLAVIANEQGWDDEERRRRANVASFTDLTMRSASDLIEEWSKLDPPVKRQDSPATDAVEGPHSVSESEGAEADVASIATPSDAGEQEERDELWSKFVRYLGGDGDSPERAEERAREIAMEQIGTYDPDLKALGPLVTKVLREGIK